MRILVTGASGMIGSHLVKALLETECEVIGIDRRKSIVVDKDYQHFQIDLVDQAFLNHIVENLKVDRIIHLAALAHAMGDNWNDYYYANVECSKNVFKVAENIPLLFISTVDVYGFKKEKVNVETNLEPVTAYGKSKAIAEEECKKICKNWTIFRFSPVYTEDIKRDIQKRYYLKYPNIAYQIGRGTEYEILSVHNAVAAMKEWCFTGKKEIRIIKDPFMMNTVDCIEKEKAVGRAKIVLHFPKWLVNIAFKIIMISGKNRYTYLINKAVYPLRTE